ncbi:MAG TPA: A/G-specific adenine glycosylase [Xanthobacteraceae bacterium]|nr:A/G-specific adenine glycosylase [Xanthobacteraceae bacterium]
MANPAGERGGAERIAPSALLKWYDRHRRALPWRARKGEQAQPYRVWLSEIMLQQTTVKTVAPYYARFLTRFPTVMALAAAPLEEVLRLWAGLGYYARARNLHACARAVADAHGGAFPDTEEALRGLPGIGAYTAAAIAAIAFDRRASPVDGNIERVIARLFAIEQELPAAKAQIRARAQALTPQRRAGDFAQAMMDLGATICTPKSPACVLCPWSEACAARSRGDPERFPRKVPRKTGRLRQGAAYVALRRDGFILLRRRPARGLLGGMTEVPSSAWTTQFQLARALDAAPLQAAWRRVPGVVTHTFTHFPLELVVYVARLDSRIALPAGASWVALDALDGAALPSVMRKVIDHAVG